MRYSKYILRTQVYHVACLHGSVIVDFWVICQSEASVGAISTLFHCHRPHLDFVPLSVHTATIRVHHQGLFHETRRDLDEDVRTSSETSVS